MSISLTVVYFINLQIQTLKLLETKKTTQGLFLYFIYSQIAVSKCFMFKKGEGIPFFFSKIHLFIYYIYSLFPENFELTCFKTFLYIFEIFIPLLRRRGGVHCLISVCVCLSVCPSVKDISVAILSATIHCRFLKF